MTPPKNILFDFSNDIKALKETRASHLAILTGRIGRLTPLLVDALVAIQDEEKKQGKKNENLNTIKTKIIAVDLKLQTLLDWTGPVD